MDHRLAKTTPAAIGTASVGTIPTPHHSDAHRLPDLRSDLHTERRARTLLAAENGAHIAARMRSLMRSHRAPVVAGSVPATLGVMYLYLLRHYG
jgi:hypothetical protein